MSRFPLQVPAFLILPLARANSPPCYFSSLLLPNSATLTSPLWNHSAPLSPSSKWIQSAFAPDQISTSFFSFNSSYDLGYVTESNRFLINVMIWLICMHFESTNVWNTLIVFSPILKGTFENGFRGVKGKFLAQWATAKLHRFTVTCFFSLFLSSPLVSVPYGFGSIPSLCWLPLPVAASDLSAPKKCRARFGLDQQNNWCGPCRCVWCVLAPARARWRPAYCTLGLPPSLSAAAFFILFSLLLSVPPGYRDLSASSSHALPVYL